MKNKLNLLTGQVSQLGYVKKGLTFWCVASGLAAGVLMWLTLEQNVRVTDSVNEVRNLEQKLVPVKYVSGQIGGLKKKLLELHKQQLINADLSSNQPTVTLLGTVSLAATDSAIQISSLTLDPLETDVSKSIDDDPRKFTLKLAGVAEDNISLARFAADLRNSNCFADVQLKSTVPEQLKHGLVRRYEIECHY